MLRRGGAALIALMLAGCGSSRPIQYYDVQVPAPPDVTRNTYPVRLLVARLNAPMILRDNRIVYRTGANEVGTYEYHRWAEPPALMVEVNLLHLLRESGKYQSVAELGSSARGDFVVRGRLRDFEEVDTETIAGRVSMEIELYEQKTGQTVWSHFYSHDEPARGGDIAAVVEALDRSLRSSLAEVTAGLEQYFAKNPPR